MRLLPIGVGLWVAGVALTVLGFVTQEASDAHERLVQTCTQLGFVITIAAFAALLAAPRTVSLAAQAAQGVVAVAAVAAVTVAIVEIYREGQFGSFRWNGFAFALALATASIGPVARPAPRRVAVRLGTVLAVGVCVAIAYGLWKYDSHGFAWVEIAYAGAFLLVALAVPLRNERADPVQG